nr:hypothetical protein CPGR_04929 [Mycolicibacterium malmesburyense]
MTDHHPLRRARGTRRENHICGVPHLQPSQPISVSNRLSRNTGDIQPTHIEHRAHPRPSQTVSPTTQYTHRIHCVQHHSNALRRMPRIQRHIDPASLHHRPPRHHQLRAPIHRHAHRALWAHPRTDQHPRQPCRPLIKLAIRPPPRTIDDRHRLRTRSYRIGQQLKSQPDRRPHLSPRPLRHHQLALTTIQQGHIPHRHRSISHHRIDDPVEPTQHPLNGGPLIQVGGISDDPRNRGRTRIRIDDLTELNIEIELRGMGLHLNRRQIHPIQDNLRTHIVLKRHRHLKQRMMRRRTHRI